MNRFLGMPRNEDIDRKSLSLAASKMKKLAPMVAANYLKFFPASYYIEPDEKIPITYSKNGYSDVLPPEILSKYRENVDVRSLRKADQGWVVEDSLKLGRAIAIQFHRDDDEKMFIYNLFEQEVIKMDEDTRIVHFQWSLPEEPPAFDEFGAWVNQSINQSAMAHYGQLFKGLMLSSNFGASFLTSSEFTHSLLGSQRTDQDVKTYTISTR